MGLKIYCSTTKDGIMSKEKKFFPNLDKEEINLLYEKTLDRLFKKLNLEYKNAVFLDEKSDNKSYRIITTNTKCSNSRILLLNSSTKNKPVAVFTTDDPIIVARVNIDDDTSISAIALGTIKNINDNIIHDMVESLVKETTAAPFEMNFYISACPKKENYILDNILELTNDAIWKKAITKKKKKYYLDIRYAIFNLLIQEIVDPNYIFFDESDTTEDVKRFSYIGNRPGKNLVCIVYSD